MRAKSRSEHKMSIREQAKAQVKGPRYEVTGQAKYQADVKKGYSELVRLTKEGGDVKIRRIRSELTYLLNNYIPQYDQKIEHLIDQWRRSGDPSYDPGVRVKLMRCRRDQSNNSNPL